MIKPGVRYQFKAGRFPGFQVIAIKDGFAKILYGDGTQKKWYKVSRLERLIKKGYLEGC